MPGNDEDDDDYVANLLKQDAKNATKKYEMVGIDAFNPKRSRSNAPKPNTNFLRNIIRQTDNHNAALLAKEAEESRARLKHMERGRRNGKEERTKKNDRDRLTPPDVSDEGQGYRKRKRSRRDDGTDGKHRRGYRRHEQDLEQEDSKSFRADRRRDLDSRHRRGRDHDRHNDSEEEHAKRRFKHIRTRSSNDSDRARDRHSPTRDKYRKRKSRRRSRSPSASRSRSPVSRSRRKRNSSRRKYDSESLSPQPRKRNSRRRSPEKDHQNHNPKTDSRTRGSDSDPLEAIVGPLPPNQAPVVKSRGRGAHKANADAMDARFSSTYNPQSDMHLDPDVEDDWGDALEALKDRQKWKEQGAKRLKAAGFTDDQVKKWERGDEKNEEDVKWTKQGESREWDRGKVIDEDGDVDLKANWGRLT